MPAGQVVEPFAKDDGVQLCARIDQIDAAIPALIREIANGAHQRSDTDATGDHDDARRFMSSKGEVTVRTRHLDWIADLHALVQIGGYDPSGSALDGDIAPALATG